MWSSRFCICTHRIGRYYFIKTFVHPVQSDFKKCQEMLHFLCTTVVISKKTMQCRIVPWHITHQMHIPTLKKKRHEIILTRTDKCTSLFGRSSMKSIFDIRKLILMANYAIFLHITYLLIFLCLNV